MNKVSVIHCSDYDIQKVYEAVSTGIEKIGCDLPQGKKVLIKPNIVSQNRPEQNTITHFSIVEALCRLLKERENQIYIGESIAFYQKGLTGKAYDISGIKDIAQKYGARLVEFEREKLVRIRENVQGLDELYIPEILFEMDMIIDACKLKTHGGMRLSGAIKNMFGCLPGGYKQKIHRWTDNEFQLSDVFIDIHKILKPKLCVMDAVVGLDGGPTALGKSVEVGVVLVSENPAALDVAAARMVGYVPEEIPMLLQAVKRGLIEASFDVEIIGELPLFKFHRLVKADLYRENNKDGIFVKDTYVELKIDELGCDGLLPCMEECPTGAIKCNGEHIIIDREQCISCYYCLTNCPEGVVRLDPSLMNRLVWGVRKLTGI